MYKRQPHEFARALESTGAAFAGKEAKARAYILAAYVWAVLARSPGPARKAIERAAEQGEPKKNLARYARMLASVVEDGEWYEAATATLLSEELAAGEAASLRFELLRANLVREQGGSALRILEEMAKGERGAHVATLLTALLPPSCLGLTRDEISGLSLIHI